MWGMRRQRGRWATRSQNAEKLLYGRNQNWCRRNGSDQIAKVELDERWHQSEARVFLLIVGIVFSVVLAEQETIVGVVTARMGSGPKAVADMQVQAHHPRCNQREADHPEGKTLAHGHHFSSCR